MKNILHPSWKESVVHMSCTELAVCRCTVGI